LTQNYICQEAITVRRKCRNRSRRPLLFILQYRRKKICCACNKRELHYA